MNLLIINSNKVFSILVSIIIISIAVNISYQKSSNLIIFMKRPLIILFSLILNLLLFRYNNYAGYAFFLLLIMLYSNVQNIEIIKEHFQSNNIDEKKTDDTKSIDKKDLLNIKNKAKIKLDNDLDNNSENNSENNSDNNSDDNSDNNSENNSGNNSDNNSENNSENNSDNNSEDNQSSNINSVSNESKLNEEKEES